ncbi:hypothetical protein GO621_09480 [Mucilaginibacter sp. HMF7410]|uniref:Uncharacterized protein n=1 Tax=Mucilaginibacter arboris TaxID=2682090 RepID=A0A7K1SWZ9_9SPHI|nr:hypothetical protein [Mucilaginibacter arboris]MVN21767.1 hypothetical protein [Mucilaginibacter arboris]
MKANHNSDWLRYSCNFVGLNISNSKNESKSQPSSAGGIKTTSWVKYQ